MLSVWSIIIYHPWFMYDLLIYDRMILRLTSLWSYAAANHPNRWQLFEELLGHVKTCTKACTDTNWLPCARRVPKQYLRNSLKAMESMTTFVTTHCIAHYWLLASDLWAVARWYSAQLVAPASTICWWPFHSRCPRFKLTLGFITSVSFMGC